MSAVRHASCSDWLGDTLGIVLLFNLRAGRPALVRRRPRRGDHLAAVAAARALYGTAFGWGCGFFDYALAGGELWSIGGFLLGWAVQLAIAAFAYRLTRARQMVRQYPWLYRAQRLAGLGGAALSSTACSTPVETGVTMGDLI